MPCHKGVQGCPMPCHKGVQGCPILTLTLTEFDPRIEFVSKNISNPNPNPCRRGVQECPMLILCGFMLILCGFMLILCRFMLILSATPAWCRPSASP